MKPIRAIDDKVLVDALSGSPVVQAHLAARAKDVAARRKQLVAQLDKLTQEAITSYRNDSAAIEAAKQARDAARVTLIQAEQALSAAIGKRSGNSYDFDRREQVLVAELVETASPTITQALERLRDEWDKALKAPAEVDINTSKNLVTGKREVSVQAARVVQPRDRVAAIRAAIETVEAMKLESDQDSVPARIAELESSLPVIGARK